MPRFTHVGIQKGAFRKTPQICSSLSEKPHAASETLLYPESGTPMHTQDN